MTKQSVTFYVETKILKKFKKLCIEEDQKLSQKIQDLMSDWIRWEDEKDLFIAINPEFKKKKSETIR